MLRVDQSRHCQVTVEKPGYQLEVSVEQIQMAGERRKSEHRTVQMNSSTLQYK